MTHVFKGHYFVFRARWYCDTDPNLEPKGLGRLFLPCHFTAKWPWTMLALLSPLGQELDPEHHFRNTEHCTHFISMNFVCTCQNRFLNFEFLASSWLLTHCRINGHHTIWHSVYLIELREEEKQVIHSTLCLALPSDMLNFLMMSFEAVSLMYSQWAELLISGHDISETMASSLGMW